MAMEPIDPGRAKRLLQKVERGFSDAPGPIWNQTGFKSVLRSAVSIGMTFFEFNGETYTIQDAGKYWFVKGPLGRGQLDKEKVMREGDEWY